LHKGVQAEIFSKIKVPNHRCTPLFN